MGLVICHIHCYCKNNDHIKIFSLKEEDCSLCDAQQKFHQPKSCCSTKKHTKKQNKSCCGNEVIYLKINSDYASSQPLNVINHFSLFKGEIIMIGSKQKICLSSHESAFLKEDIPKITGKEMVCYLHQFKMDPALIGC